VQADPDFELSRDDEADRPVVVARGELDVATTESLQKAVIDAIAGGSPVVLDLAGISFMDSTGLAGLIALRRVDAVGDRLVLRRPSEAVRRVLELTATGELFDVGD